MTPDPEQLALPFGPAPLETPDAELSQTNCGPIEGLPLLDQIRRDNGVTGARARKEAQRLKDSNPTRR